MENLQLNIENTVKTKVDKSLLASEMGSGTLDVYATPAVIALMEKAAAELIQPYLDSGITTVGTMISIEHISATPVGADVSATARLTAVDGRKYCFDVTASDNEGLIAKGKHERFSVKSEGFMKKTSSKIGKIKIEKAKRSDWKICDMPEQTEHFTVDIVLTKDEFEKLKNGFIPKEMEDKWFIYFEDNKLYIHRSWTGFCIYIVSFTDDYKISDVIVNRNPDEYTETNIKRDMIALQMRINALVGRQVNSKLMIEYIKMKY